MCGPQSLSGRGGEEKDKYLSATLHEGITVLTLRRVYKYCAWGLAESYNLR